MRPDLTGQSLHDFLIGEIAINGEDVYLMLFGDGLSHGFERIGFIEGPCRIGRRPMDGHGHPETGHV